MQSSCPTNKSYEKSDRNQKRRNQKNPPTDAYPVIPITFPTLAAVISLRQQSSHAITEISITFQDFGRLILFWRYLGHSFTKFSRWNAHGQRGQSTFGALKFQGLDVCIRAIGDDQSGLGQFSIYFHPFHLPPRYFVALLKSLSTHFDEILPPGLLRIRQVAFNDIVSLCSFLPLAAFHCYLPLLARCLSNLGLSLPTVGRP
jgi:hypothetical protein